MLLQKATFTLLGLAALSDALSIRDVGMDMAPILRRSRTINKRQASETTCLAANAVQTGSESDGQATPVAGQSASATDAANFINFCSGQTVTNGLQIKTGSCNGIVMGKIPSTTNMISAIIVSPGPGDNIAALQTFTMSVQLTGLQAGSFTNAAATYYAAPQDLNAQGQVIGHTHLTVQDLGGSLAPTTAPDPTKFVFFKGINDAGNGNGLLSATVTGGLPAGNYRVCSMTSASNHQPVLMPVAQRGAQDDCQKFTVSASGAASGSGSGGAGTGAAASSSVANTATAASAADTATASSAIAASSSSAAANAGKGGRGGRGGRTRVASASPVASSATSAAVVASGTASATATSASASTTSSAAASTGTAGALGGITAPPVTSSGNKTRPFLVSGNTFVTAAAAKQRACDIQNNACSNAVNSGKLTGVTLAQCAAQQTACNAA